jgi:hypothetical protein
MRASVFANLGIGVVFPLLFLYNDGEIVSLQWLLRPHTVSHIERLAVEYAEQKFLQIEGTG